MLKLPRHPTRITSIDVNKLPFGIVFDSEIIEGLLSFHTFLDISFFKVYHDYQFAVIITLSSFHRPNIKKLAYLRQWSRVVCSIKLFCIRANWEVIPWLSKFLAFNAVFKMPKKSILQSLLATQSYSVNKKIA